jgi:hypothetical protein
MSNAATDSYAHEPPQLNEMPVHDNNSNGVLPHPSLVLGSNFNQVLGSLNPHFYNFQSHDGSFSQAPQVFIENPTFYEFNGNPTVHNTHHCGNSRRTSLRVLYYPLT